MIQTNKGTAGSTPVDVTNFGTNLSGSDNTVQKALETIDNLALGGGSPVYYDIGTAADNEINLLVADNICDVVGFTVTVANSTNYIVKVYGASEALISTTKVRSGVAIVINVPQNLGVSSTTGFTSYKVNISSEVGANAITAFAISTAEANRKGVLKAKFGTTGLTSLANALKDCYNLNECVLPATLASVTTAASAFSGCYKLATLTFPTSMALCTDYGATFSNCYSIVTVIIPSDSTGITTLSNICLNCYKLTTLTLPTVLNSLTTIQSIVNGCRSLVTLTLPTSMSSLTGIFSTPFNDCPLLAEITECTNWGTNQLSIANGCFLLESLTTFDQSALRVAKLDLQGVNASVPNALTYIDIDYANSTYGGAAPQLDFDYCSLDATELNRIFTALPTAAKTISIIGNPGTATCNTGLATVKSWTVTTS